MRECHAEARERPAWRHAIVTRGGMGDWRVEAGEIGAWRQERMTRGGMREWHVEACERDAWRHASVTSTRVTRGGRTLTRRRRDD